MAIVEYMLQLFITFKFILLRINLLQVNVFGISYFKVFRKLISMPKPL